jgi:hypothetical protein
MLYSRDENLPHPNLPLEGEVTKKLKAINHEI